MRNPPAPAPPDAGWLPMPVELLVMRHAKSAWNTDAPDDFSRPLAPRGHRAAPRMAEWLDADGLEPDRIVTSAAVRARDTAQYVADHFSIDDDRVERVDWLYGAGATAWIGLLREQTAERVLICGHNPGLDDLVERLTADPMELTSTGKLMTTAAIAHIRVEAWSTIGEKPGQLLQLVRPRELG